MGHVQHCRICNRFHVRWRYLATAEKSEMKSPIEKVQDRLKRLSDKTYSNATTQLFGQQYQSSFGYTKGGKTVCLGPYMPPHDADATLATLEDGGIFELDTRDLHRATRVIKAELLQRTGDPDESIKRVLHHIQGGKN